ncbi:MAG: hypothetical protein WA093_00290 [Minisyncoccales bacterium]
MKDVKFRIVLWAIGFALCLMVFSPVIKEGGAILVIIISTIIGILFAFALTAK